MALSIVPRGPVPSGSRGLRRSEPPFPNLPAQQYIYCAPPTLRLVFYFYFVSGCSTKTPIDQRCALELLCDIYHLFLCSSFATDPPAPKVSAEALRLRVAAETVQTLGTDIEEAPGVVCTIEASTLQNARKNASTVVVVVFLALIRCNSATHNKICSNPNKQISQNRNTVRIAGYVPL